MPIVRVQRIWFERTFDLSLPREAFPEILERVRGTPARLEERVRELPPAIRVGRQQGRWSIQENVGHLMDLEPLWAGRLDDLLAGEDRLRPADLDNRASHDAEHDRASLDAILARFRRERMETVARLDRLGDMDLERVALHPRLEAPMTVVDLFFFVAEHDDHHLARITQIAAALDDG